MSVDSANDITIDSQLDRVAAVMAIRKMNPTCPIAVLDRQELLTVDYWSNDQRMHRGQIVVDRQLSLDISELFGFLVDVRFPVGQVKPIVDYEWDDEASMADNNSSGFNYRQIKDTPKLSLHAFGFAVDLNPRDNPVIVNGQITQPRNGERNLTNPHTLTTSHPVVSFMADRGWVWGGAWQSFQDYHHFEKRLATPEFLNYLQRMLKLGYINQVDYERQYRQAKQNSQQI